MTTSIRTIAKSLQAYLEQQYPGVWNGRPLKLYNFFSEGNQGGIRIGRGTIADLDLNLRSRSVTVGRVFPIMDTDHYEANILALELAESIEDAIGKWSECTPRVRDALNFVTEWAKAPLSQVAYEPRPTDRDIATTTDRVPIVTPAEVTPAFGAVAIVSFDLIY